VNRRKRERDATEYGRASSIYFQDKLHLLLQGVCMVAVEPKF
jgi:hypothetical protein